MFSNPEKIIENLNVVAGSNIADLGAGMGAYVIPLSKKIKKESGGRVYAVEVVKDIVDSLRKKIEDEGVSSVEVVLGDIERDGGTRLRDGSMDFVIIANTIFQSEDRVGLGKEAFRILKNNGILLLVDWTEGFNGLGPHEDNIFTEEESTELFKQIGFSVERNIDAGEHHYGILFKKEV